MGPYLRSNPVLQGRDDSSPGGIVFGICREYEEHVDGQANRKSFYLNIALLHDVEQTDLNLGSQVGELIDGKNSPMSSWQQSKVNVFLGRECRALGGRLDGVQIPDDVGDGHVGCG